MSNNSFDLTGKAALVTGGYGVLGGTIATGLAAAGARVAVLGRRHDLAAAKADEIRNAGGDAMPLVADVLDETRFAPASDEAHRAWGRIDILINAAGGNVARSRNDNRSIFEVPLDAFDEVLRLNLHGTVDSDRSSFGEAMARRGRGSIINISSMAARPALSGVLGYSVAEDRASTTSRAGWRGARAKARRRHPRQRDRARILRRRRRTAPCSWTIPASRPPGRRTIMQRTPMGRFGRPDELVGAVQWLCSDAASFVTGVVIPVDGGFSAFSGGLNQRQFSVTNA